jgi:hypothetical protein
MRHKTRNKEGRKEGQKRGGKCRRNTVTFSVGLSDPPDKFWATVK